MNLALDPPDSVYAIQFAVPHKDCEEENNVKICYSRGNPLIGYRYQIPPENNVSLHPRLFMNDIALLPINADDAKEIGGRLKMHFPKGRKRFISIDTVPKLDFYLQPKNLVNIVVKNLRGRLVSNQFNAQQLHRCSWSYYLLFTLNEG